MSDLNSEVRDLYEHFQELLSLENPDKNDLLLYKYLIENRFNNISKIERLPNLNSTIISESIVNSLVNKNHRKSFLRQVDYQFYFLLFLFFQSHQYYKSWPSLHCIIDSFLNVIKNSLKYPDVEQTESGATRCKTNIRFVINELRKLGLVAYLDRDKKRTWAPTYFGFFVSAYICKNDLFRNENYSAFKFQLSRVKKLGFLGKYDTKIYTAIGLLNSKKEFDEVLKWLKENNLDLEQLKMAPELFGFYSKSILDKSKLYDSREITKTIFFNSVSEMLTNLEDKYNYHSFMQELSLQFDAFRVFDQIKPILDMN